MSKQPRKARTRYIFVVGGVMSGVGKGITTASIGRILLAKGYRVSAVKIDPYINVDAGTMNPVEHGEVFVTADGDQTDQDIGNYERFLGQDIHRENYMTTGRVYLSVIQKERNLEYGGKCVEVVLHIPMEIRERMQRAVAKSRAEIMIVEIGGTVGEYQNLLFLEAARMMKLYHPQDVLFVMVSYLPIPEKVGEMKTKPTQYAIRTLNSAGIQPDFIVARSRLAIDEPRRKKIAVNCNIDRNDVIAAPDIDSIYEVPLNFEKDKLGERILKKFGLRVRKNDMRDWRLMVERGRLAKKKLRIGLVGKYFASGDFCLSDSYISVIEAVKHAGIALGVRVDMDWVNTDDMEKSGANSLSAYDGVVVPQGWGARGAEGKIAAIRYCREKNLPYFGLCYGMQMAVIEFARHVLGLKKANSEEVDPKTPDPVIHIMPGQKELIAKQQYGGTIRLGAWPCHLVAGTRLAHAYAGKYAKGQQVIFERHRHRYEFNNDYRERIEKAGLRVAGTSPDGSIVEAVEISGHPFFVGTQFHPEYISRPLDPHPLFVEFLHACLKRKKVRG